MSHHYSGPDFGFPHGDARLDLTDLYAFPTPGDAVSSFRGGPGLCRASGAGYGRLGSLVPAIEEQKSQARVPTSRPTRDFHPDRDIPIQEPLEDLE